METEAIEVEYVDRYSATGTPYPKQLTVCSGQCEGMGVYPIRVHEPQESYYEQYPHMREFVLAPSEGLTPYEVEAAMEVQRDEGISEDGYYFIRCGECGGSGKVPLWRGVWRLPRVLWKGVRAFFYMAPNREIKSPHMTWPQHVALAFKSAFGSII